MPYYAEVDASNIVQRVIVAPDDLWPAENLGGTWARTADPYTPDGTPGAYAGPGYGYDPSHPDRFAPPYVPIPAEDRADWSQRDLRSHRRQAVFFDGTITTNRALDIERGLDA